MREFWNEGPTEEELAADRCGSCRFFDGEREGRFYEEGACRRLPPAVVGGSATHVDHHQHETIQPSHSTCHPSVRVMDWCGEWEAVKP